MGFVTIIRFMAFLIMTCHVCVYTVYVQLCYDIKSLLIKQRMSNHHWLFNVCRERILDVFFHKCLFRYFIKGAVLHDVLKAF